MSDERPRAPSTVQMNPTATAVAAKRRAREAQALRDNLLRRKAQARARRDGGEFELPVAPSKPPR